MTSIHPKPLRRYAFAWLFIAPDEWALQDSRFRKLNVAAEIVSVQDRSMDIALSFAASRRTWSKLTNISAPTATSPVQRS